jgi:hypothetical protein
MVTALSCCVVNQLLTQGMITTAQLPWCLCICAVWASTVGFSRLYIGVHSVADLVAGLVCGLSLTAFYIKIEPALDRYFISDYFRMFIILLSSAVTHSLSLRSNRLVAFRNCRFHSIYGVPNRSTRDNHLLRLYGHIRCCSWLCYRTCTITS